MQKGSFFRLRRESNAAQPPRMPGGAAGPGGEGAAGEVESARERMARKVGGPAPAPGGGPKAAPGGGGNFMAEWKAKRETAAGGAAAKPEAEGNQAKTEGAEKPATEEAGKKAEDAPTAADASPAQ
jgi:hypothetical protein